VPEPGDEADRAITYSDLQAEVCRFANGLRSLGIGKGDVVGIYMGMVPELAVAMLACARIGAPHVVVFGGFSAEALGERLESTGATLLVTQDEAWRKGGRVPLKLTADGAVELAPTVKHMVVLARTGADVPMQEGRDHDWGVFIAGQPDTCPAEPMEAEHMLFPLHTSGTTAKPKAAVHTSGGYLTYVAVTHRWIFDIRDDDVYWCAADIGWVTGHSYIVYGPLTNGTTSILYEGDPMHPGPERHWQIIQRYGVTQYYTAPTLIRAFIKAGPDHPLQHDLSSLRLLGSVGEPINPEAWVWYWKYIGGERCPIVDTWWQTETGGILITPLPGLVTTKPGSATRPFPGIRAGVVDDQGNPVEPGSGGYLVITRPWPGMFRTLYHDDARYVSNCFSRFGAKVYFPGDGARQDPDGSFWLLGRVDDVMNVSGHRLSTIELESTLVEHPAVAEAAATAAPDPLTGQTPLCFVLLRTGYEPSDELAAELREWIGQKIGKIARPKAVIIVDDLPKTRSGKIMRRLLKDVAEGHALGDTTTLRDPAVVDDLKRKTDAVLRPTA
jgi:acetyl-CoA synthetase